MEELSCHSNTLELFIPVILYSNCNHVERYNYHCTYQSETMIEGKLLITRPNEACLLSKGMTLELKCPPEFRFAAKQILINDEVEEVTTDGIWDLERFKDEKEIYIRFYFYKQPEYQKTCSLQCHVKWKFYDFKENKEWTKFIKVNHLLHPCSCQTVETECKRERLICQSPTVTLNYKMEYGMNHGGDVIVHTIVINNKGEETVYDGKLKIVLDRFLCVRKGTLKLDDVPLVVDDIREVELHSIEPNEQRILEFQTEAHVEQTENKRICIRSYAQLLYYECDGEKRYTKRVGAKLFLSNSRAAFVVNDQVTIPSFYELIRNVETNCIKIMERKKVTDQLMEITYLISFGYRTIHNRLQTVYARRKFCIATSFDSCDNTLKLCLSEKPTVSNKKVITYSLLVTK